jgi:PAS domain S-box-containing protein
MPRTIEKSETKIINEAIDSIAAILITDSRGYFIYVNEIFCQLTGYKSTELIGRSTNIFKSGVHTEEFYTEFWSTITSGKTWKGVFCNKTKAGELIWLDTIVKPVFNKNNEIEKFIGIRFNVTENVQNKLTLKAQEEQLVTFSKFATIGEISGFVAHEINNPLTVISLAASSINLALNSEFPNIEKIKQLNTKIIKVTSSISKITSALQNFSRNETISKMLPHKFKEILEDALLITEDIVKSNEVHFIIESDIDNELLIECHKNQISQVLINLIKNACDAVRLLENRVVKLKIQANAETLEIKVLDTGARIPDEVATYLFVPYFTTKKEGKGTGIGLTISTKIIKAHGGKLFLDRESDQTCFVITIPLRQPI